jgi:alpha-L-rhamnosidase
MLFPAIEFIYRHNLFSATGWKRWTVLKRREFIFHGAAAVAVPIVAPAAIFASQQPSPLASAQVIWSAGPEAAVLETATAGSLSSSEGRPKVVMADFHCVFAREIALSVIPSYAILHLFAFTRYRLYVNGSYMGRGPSRYQNQRPEHDSRDIRRALQPGRNTIVVLAHRDAPTGRIMSHDPGFVATLELAIGGRTEVIPTDSSWLSMPERSFGPRAQAWASIAEHIDSRKTTDWILPDLTLPIWQPSAIVRGGGDIQFFPRSTPLQLEAERPWWHAPTFPIHLAVGSEIELALPEIAQAFHLLEMDAEEGSSLEVTYALPQGPASGKCTYIARAGVQIWMGGDTFAFQRLRLRVTSGLLRLTRAAAYEVRYPFERVASFTCSDPFLGQLWSICARSLEVLSEDAYVDCADRERVEWTDDSPPAFDCTRVMMRGPDEYTGAKRKTCWSDSRLLRGLLRRIALTQQPDGQLKAHSCSERFDIHAIMEDRSCDWVVLLRDYVESSGETALVRELWPTLTRLLNWYRKRHTSRGLVLAREWEVWDNPLRYQVCEGAGLNAMVYRALVDSAALASSIGRKNDARLLAEEAQSLQSDFNALLWNELEGAYDGALFGPGSEVRTQSGKEFSGPIVDGRFHPTAQANLFALYSGIVPFKRLASVRQWVLGHLNEVREPMSHYYLFRMMYEMEDEQQEAEVLKLMRTGWKNQVDSEWQTSWEGLENGGGSKVHVYGMHPGYFLTAYVLGARRDGPVDRRTILIEPRFSGIEWAKGICVTEFGPVGMEWKMDHWHRPEIVCSVPENVKARIRLRSQAMGDVLELDGRAIHAHSADGWLEATLPRGKHTIKFRN